MQLPFRILGKQDLSQRILLPAMIVLLLVSALPAFGQSADPFGPPSGAGDATEGGGNVDPFSQPSKPNDPFQGGGGDDPFGPPPGGYNPFDPSGRTVTPRPAPVEVKPEIVVEPIETSDDSKSRPAEHRILKALRSPTTIETIEVPLNDMLEQLSIHHEISILIDQRALNEVGIDPATPLSYSLNGIMLRSALELMLKEIKLTYIIANESLIITTISRAKKQMTARVYPVSDLTGYQSADGQTIDCLDSLAGMIMTAIDPNSWIEVGGPGSLEVQQSQSGTTLVIMQTHQVHRQIDFILQTLRKINEKKPAAKQRLFYPIGDLKELEAKRHIEAALRRKVKLEVTKGPLVEVVDQLATAFEIPIHIDRRALDDCGIDLGTPVTCSFNNITLQAALRMMLYETDLTYIFRSEMLIITTPEETEDYLPVRLYPVTDLVRFETEDGKSVFDTKSLIRLLHVTFDSRSWDKYGGPASIAPIPVQDGMTLAIAQRDETHDKIAKMFRTIRKKNED